MNDYPIRQVNAGDIKEHAIAVGVLLGLLTPDGKVELTQIATWFRKPTDRLRTMDQRLDQVVGLLAKLLTPTKDAPAEVFKGAKWYQIPKSLRAKKLEATPFCIVAPAAKVKKGEIGFGILPKPKAGKRPIKVYGYLPLFSYAPEGAKLIIGGADSFCKVGIEIQQLTEPAGTPAFTGVAVTADISLASGTPTFALQLLDAQGKPVATYHTLRELLDAAIARALDDVMTQVQEWLNEPIAESSVTPGVLLTAAQLLRKEGDIYYLNLRELDASGQTALQIAQHFVLSLLEPFVGTDEALVDLPDGGLFITSQETDDAIDYGFRIQATLPLLAPDEEDPKKETTSNEDPEPDEDGGLTINLALGTWLTGEDDDDNWITRSAAEADVSVPGIAVRLVRHTSEGELSFAPACTFTSVGLDIAGADDNPLFEVKGYELAGAQLRANATFGTDDPALGFGGRFNDLKMPLAPGLEAGAAGGDSQNPVAQSLLAGPKEVAAKDEEPGDQDPVSLTFSLAASYVEAEASVPAVQFYDADGEAASELELPIRRKLGPLQSEKIGLGWVSGSPTDTLSILFDGNVELGPLKIDLVGLSVGIPVQTPTDFGSYAFDLNGLGLTYAQGSVALNAALVKRAPDPEATPPRPYVSYDGTALLKAGTFTLNILGSYAYVEATPTDEGYTSLFVFGTFLKDLGGPAFFYVTGLAAGFGYNRGLNLPAQDKVGEFPLVAGLNNPALLGAEQDSAGNWLSPNPVKALALLHPYLPPERGAYWLAAGVRFTSFDLVHSSALLMIAFGRELEIALLGVSWLSLPPPSAPGAAAPAKQYAYVELGLQVKFLPEQGFLGATAILTPNSFVIDKACKLTGGAAFYLWFGKHEHAGEFVVTIGGYHPDFVVPSHFPRVPRLGFRWPVSSDVTISGDAYFALTPSAVMAGASLQILFSRGDLRAWFTARMDALVQWAPFHYDIGISVSIGASYRLKLLFVTTTVQVELGANLQIWGPQMGGEVHINWFIISFSIGFGAPRLSTPSALDWTNPDGTGFAQTLLPHKAEQAAMARRAIGYRAANRLAAPAQAVQPEGVCTITVNDGLLQTVTTDAGETVWIVRPNQFAFSALTVIPVTSIEIAQPAGDPVIIEAADVSPVGEAYYVGIRPMKLDQLVSVVRVTLSDVTGVAYDLYDKFDLTPALQRVPAAKWGHPLADGAKPDYSELLDGRLLGLERISVRAPAPTPSGDDLLKINVEEAFTYVAVDDNAHYSPDHLPLKPGQAPVGPVPQTDAAALDKLHATLMSDTVSRARADVFAALQKLNLSPRTNGPLPKLAATPAAYLSGRPLTIAASAA